MTIHSRDALIGEIQRHIENGDPVDIELVSGRVITDPISIFHPDENTAAFGMNVGKDIWVAYDAIIAATFG